MKTSASFRMVRYGVLLLFLGMLTGILVMHVKNPRMGLSAHLEGVMAGMMLILLGGAVWERLSLPRLLSAAAFWLAVYSAYATWSYTLLGAILGTSKMTPIAGKGFSAPAWQEALVGGLLVSEVLCILALFPILLYGMRREEAQP